MSVDGQNNQHLSHALHSSAHPIYESDLCPEDLSFLVFALCHNGTGVDNLFPI